MPAACIQLFGAADSYVTPLTTLSFPAGSAPVGGFVFGSINFTAPAGQDAQPILVRIQGYDDPQGYRLNSCSWGAVSLTYVPEPGTLALLATGLVGLLAYAWRKRK